LDVVEWRKAPWTLRAYVVITVASVVVVTVVVLSSTPVTPRIFFVAFEVVVCIFLLRRVRWLWLFVIAFTLLGFALGMVEDNLTWHGIAEGIVTLVLLLHPATQEFFAGSAGAESAAR
jgi:hypothetical protein